MYRKEERGRLGKKGEGESHCVKVQAKDGSFTFYYYDLRDLHTIERPVGTQAQIVKGIPHMDGEPLIPDTPDARNILYDLGLARHIEGDIFMVRPRKDTRHHKKLSPHTPQSPARHGK